MAALILSYVDLVYSISYCAIFKITTGYTHMEFTFRDGDTTANISQMSVAVVRAAVVLPLHKVF